MQKTDIANSFFTRFTPYPWDQVG